jgi:phospholipase C
VAVSSRFLLGAVAVAGVAVAIGVSTSPATAPSPPKPKTPIEHVVVIFGENNSFDHYFGTYPNAANPPGQTAFIPRADTPAVNGLTSELLTHNPNSFNPRRLDRSEAVTCDQNHQYAPEQAAYNRGAMDKFVQNTTGGSCTQSTTKNRSNYGPQGIVMGYYDGNTVTAWWNLAQHFTLSDNYFTTTFGQSTIGAINLISANTNGVALHGGTSSNVRNGTMVNNVEPLYDQCANPSSQLNTDGTVGGVTGFYTNKNIGDLMNAAGVTWGWFQGGFTPSSTVVQRGFTRAVCSTSHQNVGGARVTDYVPHHDPFAYYASTANVNHVSPSSVDQVGISDPEGTPATQAVNHNYDLTWFTKALDAGKLPQVSFLKAPAYANGHPGNSDPLDEQQFIADMVNAVQKSQFWDSTAIVLTYDDSDGWYDHVQGPITHVSHDSIDVLTGPGECGTSTTPAQNDKCGVGPRVPLLIASPWVRSNHVDHTFTEQASIIRFIEDNWGLPRLGGGSVDAEAGSIDAMFDFDPSHPRAPAVLLDRLTGAVVGTSVPGGAGGTVPATLSLSLNGTSAGLGTFVPGVARTYEATLGASITSTAADATLSVADPATTAPGHLVNGTFSLPAALQVKATDVPNPEGAYAPLGGGPLTLLTESQPLSNDPVTIAFRQEIGAGDALRTGPYSKTLTFTLATTSP